MVELSMKSFQFLLCMADMGSSWITNDSIEEEFGDDLPILKSHGLLFPGPNMDSIKAWPGDDTFRPIIEFDEETETVLCFHPDDGFIRVSIDATRTWRLENSKFVQLICRMLGLPTSFRPEAIVNDLLWNMGTPRLGRSNVPMLFARELRNEEARRRIRTELELLLGGIPYVLLTPDRHVAFDLCLPAVSKIVQLEDIVDRFHPIARLNLDRLAAVICLNRSNIENTELAVECEADGHRIRIHGKTYSFRGMQAQFVRLLYDAWAQGDEWVRIQFALEQVNSTSRQIKWLFKGKEDWESVIEIKNGNCRLRVEET
ncbi:Protein of unassigned function [Azospirillaceae bacterium]